MLKSVTFENFTILPSAHFDFSTGINAFVGENGTGKTHLLKAAYCVNHALSDLISKPFYFTKNRTDIYFEERLIGLFQTNNLINLLPYHSNSHFAQIVRI